MDFRLNLEAAAQRRIGVTLEIDRGDLPEGDEAEFFIPVWTPGSYLVREFSRQISDFSAKDSADGRALNWRKSSKNSYAVELQSDTRSLRIQYQVYAHELSVRTAFADPDFVYWNGASVLLWPRGAEHRPARLQVSLVGGQRLHCGLAQHEIAGGVELQFADLDQAVDSPCLVSTAEQLDFEACGKRHTLVLCGLEGIETPASLLTDCTGVVEEAAAIFGGELPYENYTFLCLFSSEGRGGLEHANSSTLLASRNTFHPRAEYQDFLSLIAHEQFHAWNGKRMRPVELWEYDYERENYSELLWVVEGFTAYYDDHICLRAGVLNSESYLEILAGHVRAMISMPGRLVQSLCEASFDAWIRFYRPDENTSNSTQNYYSNGALAAFCLDARIRAHTGGVRCLDHAVADLFRTTFMMGRGYTRQDLLTCLNDAAGEDLTSFLSALVDGRFEPDLDSALAVHGIELRRPEIPSLHLGLHLQKKELRVAKVFDSSPAYRAGIAPDDEILALNGLRVSRQNFGATFSQVARPDRQLTLLVARRGKILELDVQPEHSLRAGLKIVPRADASEAQLSQRSRWLRSRTGSM